MVLKRCMNDDFLSCTYLVGDGSGGACFVDAGGPVDPLIEFAQTHELNVTHVLLTHHHHDHVSELAAITDAFPGVEVLIHPSEADLVEGVTGTIEDGETVRAGGIGVRAIHTPGHTRGMLNFVAGDDLFTGDTLFKGSVGGVRAPGHTTYGDLKSSIMDKLMQLDHDLQIRPGHTDPTTVGDEWETNPFIRLWRGLDEEGDEEVTVMGEPARLILLGPDYDGGHKAWIRWPNGNDDIVPGSVVQRPSS
jgi:glyoxylase-like metal-dependent hydrolase (beta-lactamase superfamily II)